MARVPRGLVTKAKSRQRAQRRDSRKLALQARAKIAERKKITRWLAKELESQFLKAYRSWRKSLAASMKVDARGIPEPTPAEIRAIVDKPLAGESWRDRIRSGRFNAGALARTEADRMNRQAQERALRDLLKAEDAKKKRLIGWSYQTQKDDLVRLAHRKLRGRIYKVGQKRPTMPNGPRCRCWYLPVMGKKR